MVAVVALRGSRNTQIAYLYEWIRGLDGARLRIRELEPNPRIHREEDERIAVYTGEAFVRRGVLGEPEYDFPDGRLLIILCFTGPEVSVEWVCPTHAGLAQTAIARLRERFG